MAFKAKVEDVPGLQGIIVALTGFQSGAKKFAQDNGIVALESADLPSLGMLIGKRIEAAALPDPDTLGEPFWSIWEVQGGQSTGTLWCDRKNGRDTIVLSFSRLQAEQFLKSNSHAQQFAVRGMTQVSLRFYMLTINYFRSADICVFDPFNLDTERETYGILLEPAKILKYFYFLDPPVTDADLEERAR